MYFRYCVFDCFLGRHLHHQVVDLHVLDQSVTHLGIFSVLRSGKEIILTDIAVYECLVCFCYEKNKQAKVILKEFADQPVNINPLAARNHTLPKHHTPGSAPPPVPPPPSRPTSQNQLNRGEGNSSDHHE